MRRGLCPVGIGAFCVALCCLGAAPAAERGEALLPAGSRWTGLAYLEKADDKKVQHVRDAGLLITSRDQTRFEAELRVVPERRSEDAVVLAMEGTVTSAGLSAKVTRVLKGTPHPALLDAKYHGEFTQRNGRLVLTVKHKDDKEAPTGKIDLTRKESRSLRVRRGQRLST